METLVDGLVGLVELRLEVAQGSHAPQLEPQYLLAHRDQVERARELGRVEMQVNGRFGLVYRRDELELDPILI